MNTEQKELITLAAKAMGYEHAIVGTEAVIRVRKDCPFDDPTYWWYAWNPYTSADNLLDMMCQLKIEPMWDDDLVYCHINGGPSAATATEYFKDYSRREALAWAAVRVAAEIGRRLV